MLLEIKLHLGRGGVTWANDSILKIGKKQEADIMICLHNSILNSIKKYIHYVERAWLMEYNQQTTSSFCFFPLFPVTHSNLLGRLLLPALWIKSRAERMTFLITFRLQ